MRRHLFRHAAAALGAALFAAAASAQPASPSYAVVSEMAREVSVITYQEATGTRLSPNLRTRIDIPEGALDKLALVAARQALNKARSGAPVWLLAPMDSDFFDALQNPAEGDSVKLPADLAAALKQRGSTHLLLMQRFRGDALLKATRDRMGTGKLEGLGFFVDRTTPMREANVGYETKGFIAPYVHVRLSLVDAASGRVLRTRVVTESHVTSTRDTMAGKHPWEAFTPAEKVEMLRAQLVAEIERVVPELVAGS